VLRARAGVGPAYGKADLVGVVLLGGSGVSPGLAGRPVPSRSSRAVDRHGTGGRRRTSRAQALFRHPIWPLIAIALSPEQRSTGRWVAPIGCSQRGQTHQDQFAGMCRIARTGRWCDCGLPSLASAKLLSGSGGRGGRCRDICACRAPAQRVGGDEVQDRCPLSEDLRDAVDEAHEFRRCWRTFSTVSKRRRRPAMSGRQGG
jgi:hypothetical protein